MLMQLVELLLILAVVIAVMWASRWQLSKGLGGSLLVLYFCYVCFNILVDRDIIPLLGPLRDTMGVDIASCENERC